MRVCSVRGLPAPLWHRVPVCDRAGRVCPAGRTGKQRPPHHGGYPPQCGRVARPRRPARRAVLVARRARRRFHAGGSRQRRPATEPTEVRIAFDGESLYMGVTCFDSEPDKWLGYQRRRDEFLAVRRPVHVDDRHVPRRPHRLLLRDEPARARWPTRSWASTDRTAQWDGIWNARVRRSEIGWTLEIEIPFRTLNFNPNSDTWGINFQRTVQRKNEDEPLDGMGAQSGSAPDDQCRPRHRHPRRDPGPRPRHQAVRRCSPRKPRPDAATAASTATRNAGLDLFYNPTPLLRTNLTINTDFAQTEVDQRQVNLTRFSLFFPGAARLLPRRRHLLRLRRTAGDGNSGTCASIPVLQPAHRPERRRHAAEDRLRHEGHGTDGRPGRRRPARPHRRRRRAADRRRLHGGARQAPGAAAVLRRRDLYAPRPAHRRRRRRARRLVSTAGWPPPAFWAAQNLETSAWLLHATRPAVSGGNSAFGGTVNYPNDRWNARVGRQRGAGELRSRPSAS